MYIGKLNKFCFVDIKKDKGLYSYTYLLQSQRFFLFKLNWKMLFVSKLPFYLFTDISKVFFNEGFYFEDLINNDVELQIGSINVKKFTKSDQDTYSGEYAYWDTQYLDDALDKQKNYKIEYEKEFGYPEDLGVKDAWDNAPDILV